MGPGRGPVLLAPLLLVTSPTSTSTTPRSGARCCATVDFWLDLGVDGLRLDAVPYLFEREGTNCENLPETHEFLKELRAHVDAHFDDRMLLAEANQWPEDAVAYFGDGDECHMAFHFPLMPRLFMAPAAWRTASRSSTSCEQTPPIPDELPVGACSSATTTSSRSRW